MFKVSPFCKRYSFLWVFLAFYLVLALKWTNPSQILGNDPDVFVNPSGSSYQLANTSFFPHLPLQMYTENRRRFLQATNRTKKTILLANRFFTDRTWSVKSLHNRSTISDFSEFYCSFLNDFCQITTDIERFAEADAVLYHLRDPIDRSEGLMKQRRPSQRFVFVLWEPPINSPDLHSYRKFFNWTMTYRFDSHVFSPYYLSNSYRSKTSVWFDYRKEEEFLLPDENTRVDGKKGTAAALISNCGESSQKRWQMVEELRKYIDVTVYGRCGKPCPPSVDCRKYIADNYYFFLTWENSLCQDYITEKFFSTISLPIVPVVSGEIDYKRFVPSSGFIDPRSYSTLAALAEDLRRIRANSTLYQSYFHWKRDFVWGGFSTYMSSFCDLCLRLHLDTDVSIVDNIQSWWHDRKCQ